MHYARLRAATEGAPRIFPLPQPWDSWDQDKSVIADGIAEMPGGKEIGVIVFAKSDRVVPLEVFSYDDVPARLPTLDPSATTDNPRIAKSDEYEARNVMLFLEPFYEAASCRPR